MPPTTGHNILCAHAFSIYIICAPSYVHIAIRDGRCRAHRRNIMRPSGLVYIILYVGTTLPPALSPTGAPKWNSRTPVGDPTVPAESVGRGIGVLSLTGRRRRRLALHGSALHPRNDGFPPGAPPGRKKNAFEGTTGTIRRGPERDYYISSVLFIYFSTLKVDIYYLPTWFGQFSQIQYTHM